MLKINPFEIDIVQHKDSKIPLYPHQAIMLDEWRNHNNFLLITKTGTGKTIGAVLPLIRYKERAILVYPTNELIGDQIKNISDIAEREGLVPCIFTPETSADEYSKADLVLVHIDAESLEEWSKRRHLGGKWAALKYLLEADKPVKLILTNPDILFLVFALRYRAEPLASLTAYKSLIIDEFHLYQGVEFAHALFMVYLARSFGMFQKVTLLSATPDRDVMEYIKKVLLNPFIIDSGIKTIKSVVGKRIAVHAIEVKPILITDDIVEIIVGAVKDIKEEISTLRKNNCSVDYIPAVTVVNSVVNAIRLEDRLVEEGFDRENLLMIRGLSSRKIRKRDEKKIIAIGTSAIEVGIDFKCDYLIFEASEAASFMQRFGRVGRHKPGKAYVVCPNNVTLGMERLFTTPIERGCFEEMIYQWYQSSEARAWFTTTYGGFVTIFALAYSIVDRVKEDKQATKETIKAVEQKIQDILASYAKLLGAEKQFNRVKRQFEKASNGVKEYTWLKVYQGLATFRTSMPSVCVCDFGEKERRGSYEESKYIVDIVTLLKRAEGLRFNENLYGTEGEKGILTVKGYGKYKKVWINPTFSDQDIGSIKTTKDYPELAFIQEGHKTSVSHLMTFKDHIFTIVPTDVMKDLDWRLAVFQCGKHLIAFDGSALLLKEIFCKTDRLKS
ncbi:MAG: type I-D CRISPR-associated helicase Cas3' [Thermodesulfovibrionales bacterium]